MGKFEQIIEARQKLCEFNENPVSRTPVTADQQTANQGQNAPAATQQSPENVVLNRVSQDANLIGAFQNYAQTGTVDPSIQDVIQQLGDQAPQTVNTALQAIQQQNQQQDAANQPAQPPPAQPAQQPAAAPPAQPAQPAQVPPRQAQRRV